MHCSITHLCTCIHNLNAAESDESKRPELRELLAEVATKTNKWKAIAIELNFELSEIELIDLEQRGEIRQCFMQVFDRWKRQCSPENPYSWATMIKVLHSPIVEENALARRISKKYSHAHD